MAFQNFALFPHMSALRQYRERADGAQGWRETMIKREGRAGRRAAEDRACAWPRAARTVERPEAAHRAGPRAGRASPRCCCSTIRCATSTPSCATRCGWSCRVCCARLRARRCSTSPRTIKEAMALGDRIAVLLDGGFEQVAHARARSTRARRRSRSRACSAIRRSTSCRSSRVAQARRLSIGFGGAELPLPAAMAAWPAQACVLGLRPEDVDRRRHGAPESVPGRARRGDAAQREDRALLRSRRRPRNPGVRSRRPTRLLGRGHGAGLRPIRRRKRSCSSTAASGAASLLPSA